MWCLILNYFYFKRCLWSPLQLCFTAQGLLGGCYNFKDFMYLFILAYVRSVHVCVQAHKF